MNLSVVEREWTPCDHDWLSSLVLIWRWRAKDNAPKFGTFRSKPRTIIMSSNASLSAVWNFHHCSVLTHGSCESTSFPFARPNPFGGCFVFQIDHFVDETKRFRWLMSTPGARPNHRKSLFYTFWINQVSKILLNYENRKLSWACNQ